MFSTSVPPPIWNSAFPTPTARHSAVGDPDRKADAATRRHPAAENARPFPKRSVMTPMGICSAKAQKL